MTDMLKEDREWDVVEEGAGYRVVRFGEKVGKVEACRGVALRRAAVIAARERKECCDA